MSKEYIIPIFIPHGGCKKRCAFCNEYSATGIKEKPDTDDLEIIYKEYKGYFKKNKKPYIAFYGSTFTGLENTIMEYYLEWANSKYINKEIEGIRFSTSPEEITQEKINILKKYPVNLVEIGVQSFYNDVLALSNRSHNTEDIWNACVLMKNNGIEFGLHLMTGLPGSSYMKDINSALLLTFSGASYARIHPTVVLKNTLLEREKYIPETIEKSVKKTAVMKMILELNKIHVIRTGICLYGDEINNVVRGPYSESFGDLVNTFIYSEIIKTNEKNSLKFPKNKKGIVYGYKKKNCEIIKEYGVSFTDSEEIFLNNQKTHTEFFYPKIIEKYI